MRLLVSIALRHLIYRRRQSIVSVLGIILGSAFFLAISSLMQGSERDFIRRLVDNSPHITIEDQYRVPRLQPVALRYARGAVELRNVKPVTETRGIRGFEQVLAMLRADPDVIAAPALAGQALVNFAGKDFAVTLNGMNPQDVKGVTTIENYMKVGSIDELIADPDGVVIGNELAKRLSLSRGDNISIAATTGQVRTFKILGIFRTGRFDYDERQVFVSLKRVQALLNRSNRVNSIIMKISRPTEARVLSEQIERQIGYKAISWQELSEDLLSTLKIRNTIMYTVVSAVLLVAAFGIYNVISTVVIEKHRDIAILKAMGFHAGDIQKIFVTQGVLLGLVGCLFGLPLGMVLMTALMQVKLKIPGTSELIYMPLDWSWPQFVVAGAFAMFASIVAAWLPARKAARVEPVEILRGGT